jgi:ketosteroid isomerase-like protein
MSHKEPQRDVRAANRAVAAGFLDAIAAGDIDLCAALLHPDAVWWVQGWGEISAPLFLTSLEGTIERSSSRSIQIGLMTAEEDRVAVQANGEFVFAEGVYANSYHYLFEIADGRIVKGYEYLDTRIAAAFFATTNTSKSAGEIAENGAWQPPR